MRMNNIRTKELYSSPNGDRWYLCRESPALNWRTSCRVDAGLSSNLCSSLSERSWTKPQASLLAVKSIQVGMPKCRTSNSGRCIHLLARDLHAVRGRVFLRDHAGRDSIDLARTGRGSPGARHDLCADHGLHRFAAGLPQHDA